MKITEEMKQRMAAEKAVKNSIGKNAFQKRRVYAFLHPDEVKAYFENINQAQLAQLEEVDDTPELQALQPPPVLQEVPQPQQPPQVPQQPPQVPQQVQQVDKENLDILAFIASLALHFLSD